MKWARLAAALIAAGTLIGSAGASDLYVRAVAGLDRPAETAFTDLACSSVSPAAVYECGRGGDGAPYRSVGDFGMVPVLELGLGYAAAPAVRLEVLAECCPWFAFGGHTNFLETGRRQSVAADLVRQANWQKVGGASPPKRRSNRTTFLREPCVGSREGAGEASVAAWMGRAIEHRKSDDPGCRGFQIGRRQYRRHRFGEMSASPAVSENPCTFARLLLGPWEVFKLPRLS